MRHAERDPSAPPCDALAECVVLNYMLENPSLIDSVDVGADLVFPEHRWCWAALVRTHTRWPDLSFGHFYVRWVTDLESDHPGDGHRLADLLLVADDVSSRAWQEYERDMDRSPNVPRLQTDYSHRFEWWLARLRTITALRGVIDRGHVIVARAWHEDLDGAVEAALQIFEGRDLEPHKDRALAIGAPLPHPRGPIVTVDDLDV